MILKHQNWKYDGDIPFFIGDRRYGQDMARDFFSAISHIGSAIQGVVGQETFLLKGGIVTKGTLFTDIDITELFAIIKTTVDIPGSFSTIPPSKTTADISIPSQLSTQTDINLGSANLDGATTNYVKASYSVTDGNTRTRAKKAGSYSYEVQPTVIITVDTTAPVSTELQLATLVGDGSSFLTITDTEYIRPTAKFDGVQSDNVVLKTKVIEIGDWDMDTDPSVLVAHGITDYKKIRGITVIVRDDNDSAYYDFATRNMETSGSVAPFDFGIGFFNTTDVTLIRADLGQFNAVLFDSTSFNRGWITITSEV